MQCPEEMKLPLEPNTYRFKQLNRSDFFSQLTFLVFSILVSELMAMLMAPLLLSYLLCL